MRRLPTQEPLAELVRAVHAGDRSPVELVERAAAAFHSVEEGAEPLGAFVSTDFELAARRAQGLHRSDGALAGIPVALKDNLATVDFPTTCGSRVLQGYRSPYDATVVRRLTAAGAVVVGKTNLDEFAMGSSTEFSAFGPTRNPHDRDRVPGGSSGGSAAAVAAGVVPVALGSDTGGSVRQPAAFCGVVGIKPTYGRVSRYGLVSFAPSLDQVGVLAPRVADAARVLEAIAGPDPLDATSVSRPVAELRPGAEVGVEGMVVGVPEELFPDSLHPGVRAACRAALRRLESLGVELREVSLPHVQHAIPVYYLLAPAEASANLARFDGVRFGARAPDARGVEELYERTRALFGPEVKRRLVLGAFVLSEGYHDAYYARAQGARARIAEDFRFAFASGIDALFSPTTPTPAFRLGERTADPYEMYLADVFTVPANLAGLPALSLPIGEADGLPVGGQLIGPAWGEARILRLARALEGDGAGGSVR